MTALKDMSYEEFGKMRFLDFFPKTDAYQEDHEGGLETGIGLVCTEGYVDTMFTSPVDTEWQTSEILLSFENGDCPEAAGDAFLAGLGLGLRKGMTQARVKDLLGTPVKTFPTSLGLHFVIGSTWHYYVGCSIKENEGLFAVWICRKDLADKQEELES